MQRQKDDDADEAGSSEEAEDVEKKSKSALQTHSFLRKTTTIRKDLDKHLLMLDVIPTTHKTELRKMVKK